MTLFAKPEDSSGPKLDELRAFLDKHGDCGEEVSIGHPSARITGDKGRENPAEGAPYGEGLIGRIDTLSSECQRLRTALQYIADLAYVDHQSGNQNFECLQGIARDAILEQSND